MKHRWLIAIAALVLAVAAFAGTTITVSPDEMKNGEKKTLTDDGQKITLSREGDILDIQIDGAGKTRTVIIRKSDGTISIGRTGDLGDRIVIGPERFEFKTLPHVMPKFGKTQTWYVCPKDHTMLRVPEGKEGETFKCPLDGTTMEKRKGQGFSLFFDDDFFGSEDL